MSRRVGAVRAAPRAVPRRAPSRTASALRSWQALLVTLGLLIAQGPMLAHLLLVRHVTCEHGELVEGAGHDGEFTHDADLRTASRSAHEASTEEGTPGDRVD